jgi:hypothetical protein
MLKPGKGTVGYDLDHKVWFNIDGNRLYEQRTIMNNPDSISYPEKYRHKLPCVIRIVQRYERGDDKGMLMFPDLYVLRDHMIIAKKTQMIQNKKCDGWVVPIQVLEDYKPGHKLV